MVQEIVTVSQAGRAPRQSPGIFALAIIMALATPDKDMIPKEGDSDEQKASKANRTAATRKVCLFNSSTLPFRILVGESFLASNVFLQCGKEPVVPAIAR